MSFNKGFIDSPAAQDSLLLIPQTVYVTSKYLKHPSPLSIPVATTPPNGRLHLLPAFLLKELIGAGTICNTLVHSCPQGDDILLVGS